MAYVGRDVASSLDAVFLHAAVGLAVVNLEDRCLHANPVLERMLGVRPGEPVRARGEDVIPASGPEKARLLMEETLAGSIDSYRLQKQYQLAESKDGLSLVKKLMQELKSFSHVDTSDDWVWVDIHQGLESTTQSRVE